MKCLSVMLLGAALAGHARAEIRSMNERTTPRTEPETRKVVVSCYDDSDPCRELKRILGSESCNPPVEVVSTPYNASLDDRAKTIRDANLPPDTLVLTVGHGSTASGTTPHKIVFNGG